MKFFCLIIKVQILSHVSDLVGLESKQSERLLHRKDFNIKVGEDDVSLLLFQLHCVPFQLSTSYEVQWRDLKVILYAEGTKNSSLERFQANSESAVVIVFLMHISLQRFRRQFWWWWTVVGKE